MAEVRPWRAGSVLKAGEGLSLCWRPVALLLLAALQRPPPTWLLLSFSFSLPQHSLVLSPSPTSQIPTLVVTCTRPSPTVSARPWFPRRRPITPLGQAS